MGTSMIRCGRAVMELVRKDLIDVRLLLGFVLMLDVAIVLIAHLVLDDELVALAVSRGRFGTALGVLSMIPIVAEIYCVDERVGTSALVRALPIARWARAVSKVVAVVCVIGLGVVVVLSVQELLYAVGGAVDASRLPRGIGWDELIRPGLAIMGGAILVTAFLSVVVRNSLVAMLGPLVVLGLLVGTEHWLAGSGEDWILFVWSAVLLGAGPPVALITALVFLLAMTPLRGVADRSLVCRSMRALGWPMLLAGAAFAGVTLHESRRAAPEFGGADAYVREIVLSPDGERVAMGLVHVDGAFTRGSIWIADTSTWEFVRAPELPPSSRLGFPEHGTSRISSWTTDGRSLLGHRTNGGGASPRHFAIDPDTRVVSPSSNDEAWRHMQYHGVRTRRTPATGYKRHVELLDGSWRSIGDQMPQVPARANELVFYADDELALHRLNRATGEDSVLPIEVESPGGFGVSPDGRYVLVSHLGGPKDLFDLDSGRSRKVDGWRRCWTRRDAICVMQAAGAFFLVTMDGDEPIDLGTETRDLMDVDGRHWLRRSPRLRSVELLDADGTLVRTIFESQHE